jgi:hypothetical protein
MSTLPLCSINGRQPNILAYGVIVSVCHRDKHKRHDGSNQDTHRVAHLEEDERRYDNAGRHNIATPNEGSAATIRSECKIEEKQSKAPECEGGPTAVAAEVDLGIAIVECKALVVAIHTEHGIERNHSAYKAEERHGA